MLTQIEITPFLNRVVQIFFNENDIDTVETGRLVSITEHSLTLENLERRRTVISLDKIFKIKEKRL